MRRTLMMVMVMVLVAGGALPAPAPQALAYEDASEGLPKEKPGTSDDAGWTGLRFGDVNGDGWMDLAAVGRKGNGSRVYLGHGDGTWSLSNAGIASHFTGRSDLRFGDVNGDGALDIVESASYVWLGDGAGAWSAGPQRLPFDGEDVALGDVDNDGDLDAVVVGHLTGGIKAFLNDGTGRWTASSAGLPGGSNGGHKVDLADVDLDGCLDVVGTYWYDGGVWLGDCAGRWRDASEGLKGFQGWDVAAGDVNGDLLPDVVFSTFHQSGGTHGLRVFLGDGAGKWLAKPVVLGAESWGGLALEDVDGDGALDILAGNTCFGSCAARVVLLLGDGSGGFQEVDAGLPAGGDELEGLAAADIDHSGVLDAGLPHYGAQGVRVWREKGSPAAAAVRVLEPWGGEVWVGGGLRTIRWAAAVPPGDGPGTVDLHYSATGPGGPWRPIALGLANGGAHTWKVADASSANAFVRVTLHAGDATAFGTNPQPFGLNARPGAGPRVVVEARASPAQLAPLDAAALGGTVRNEGFARVEGMLTVTLSRGAATLHTAQRAVDLADGEAATLDAAWLADLAQRPGGYAVRVRFEGTGHTAEGSVSLGRGASAAFTLVRPWLDVQRSLNATQPAGKAFATLVTLTNTGNLPAHNVTWEERVPLAHLPQPDPNRASRALLRDPARALPAALLSEPPAAEARVDAENRTWVLTYRFSLVAAGGSAAVRFDLLPTVPGNHTFATDARYEHHYAHRAEPTAFRAGAASVQAVRLPLP